MLNEQDPGIGPKSRAMLVFELASGQEWLRIKAPIGRMSYSTLFSADGKKLFTIEAQPGHKDHPAVWNLPAKKVVQSLRVPSTVGHPKVMMHPLVLRNQESQFGTLFEDGQKYMFGVVGLMKIPCSCGNSSRLIRPEDMNSLGCVPRAGQLVCHLIDMKGRTGPRFYELHEPRQEILGEEAELPGAIRFCAFSRDGRATVIAGPGGVYLFSLKEGLGEKSK